MPEVAQRGSGGARPGIRPSSGALPLLVLLAMVTAVSGVVLLLYVDGPGPWPGSRSPEQAAPAGPTASPTPECPIPTTHSQHVIETVYRIGSERDVPDRVMLAAFEAGWVESHMRNLDCGHKDSLGVFQQRPSQGWGTQEEVRDVRHAANRFFAVAQKKHRQSPDGTAGELAQRVQVSAFPERYDEAESKARELLREARRLAASK